ncbi:MAG: hypothetical protein QM811_18415 [Pirellulales bacterium]
MLEDDDSWRRGRRSDDAFDDEAYDDEDSPDDDAHDVCRHCGATLFDEEMALCPRCGQAPSREDTPDRPKPLWIVVTAIVLFLIFAWFAISH